MKRKGFTLVELLAVIVILGVILIIAVPTFSTVINNSKKQSYIATAKMYLNAAKQQYILDDETGYKRYLLEDLGIDDDVSPFGNSYDFGFVFIEPKDGKNEASIFLHDSQGYSIGLFDKQSQMVFTETDETLSNNSIYFIPDFGISFDTITVKRKTNKEENSKMYLIEDISSEPKIKTEDEFYVKGEFVYLKDVNGDCNPFVVLIDSGIKIKIVEKPFMKDFTVNRRIASSDGTKDVETTYSKFSEKFNNVNYSYPPQLLSYYDVISHIYNGDYSDNLEELYRLLLPFMNVAKLDDYNQNGNNEDNMRYRTSYKIFIKSTECKNGKDICSYFDLNTEDILLEVNSDEDYKMGKSGVLYTIEVDPEETEIYSNSLCTEKKKVETEYE